MRSTRFVCLLADNFRFYFTPFNGFFSPFPHGTGSLSVLGVFSLGGWLPRIPSTLGRGTQVLPGVLWISPTRLSLSLAEHSRSFGYPLYSRLGALQPPARGGVWAFPLSLAATNGITIVFFSSGYLDVSVRRVPPPALRAEIPIFNFQIPNKLQFSKSKILKFFYLELEVYLEFGTWCLEFPRAKHEGYPGLPPLSRGYPRPKGRFLRVTHPSAANATANIQLPTFSFLEKPPNCLITLSHISIASL